MAKIKFTIDNKELIADENQTILNIARANNIFIPALCYLNKCKATLACRLCLVEADGKQLYACNAKPKENMQISTITENIAKEREAIMQVYDVNHPLQCGVCDKSGECELQDYTLFMKINSQNYAIENSHKPTQKWGVMDYDASLCIVCERCVTVCSDLIGSNALSTLKRGAKELDKTLKESMPKDAYAMWNKLNKSLIGHDSSLCVSCGECIAVCPTGAMLNPNFQYSSNVWELQKIPASNPHSSDCALLYYEVKQKGVFSFNEKKIYRVKNDSHFSALNGAARFMFNYENSAKKDEIAFNNAVFSFKNAKNIIFNSFITNEEAYILQKISNKTGAKLVNSEAKRYKEFLENFHSTSGKTLYSGNLNKIEKSDFIISLGAFLKQDAPSVKNSLNNALKMNKANALYFHPLEEIITASFGKKGKNIEHIYHKPMLEEYILAFILKLFTKENLNHLEELSFYLEKLELNEEFLETISSFSENKTEFSLIVGEDLIFHPRARNLALLCGLIERYTDFEILIIPPKTNSLGVALLCDLEEKVDGFSIGYNVGHSENADFILSSLNQNVENRNNYLDMPTLLQQEGTFVNIDKTLVPTNAALAYDGYTLNDIANEILDEKMEFTIDYTKTLPTNKGFKNIEFDELPNYFGNDQIEYRGYKIESFTSSSQKIFEDIVRVDETLKDDEIYIYKANPLDIFNEYCAKSANILEDKLFISEDFAKKFDIEFKDNVKNSVEFSFNNSSYSFALELDLQLKGEIPYLSSYLRDSKSNEIFTNSRFQKVKLQINSEAN